MASERECVKIYAVRNPTSTWEKWLEDLSSISLNEQEVNRTFFVIKSKERAVHSIPSCFLHHCLAHVLGTFSHSQHPRPCFDIVAISKERFALKSTEHEL